MNYATNSDGTLNLLCAIHLYLAIYIPDVNHLHASSLLRIDNQLRAIDLSCTINLLEVRAVPASTQALNENSLSYLFL